MASAVSKMRTRAVARGPGAEAVGAAGGGDGECLVGPGIEGDFANQNVQVSFSNAKNGRSLIICRVEIQYPMSYRGWFVYICGEGSAISENKRMPSLQASSLRIKPKSIYSKPIYLKKPNNVTGEVSIDAY